MEDDDYRAHLANFVNQDEVCLTPLYSRHYSYINYTCTQISSCTGLAALIHANTRGLKGYSATGVVMVCCARHGFVMSNGVGDLQKGERYAAPTMMTVLSKDSDNRSLDSYCNVDYVVLSVLSHLAPGLLKLVSYDIACQWIKNLLDRILLLPNHLQISLPAGEIRYAIPKYYFNAHKERDHNQFSLNLLPGVGRTDGEEIERNWSRHDGAASSTREMGPGSRHDVLEDHFGWANWQKMTRLGMYHLHHY